MPGENKMRHGGRVSTRLPACCFLANTVVLYLFEQEKYRYPPRTSIPSCHSAPPLIGQAAEHEVGTFAKILPTGKEDKE